MTLMQRGRERIHTLLNMKRRKDGEKMVKHTEPAYKKLISYAKITDPKNCDKFVHKKKHKQENQVTNYAQSGGWIGSTANGQCLKTFKMKLVGLQSIEKLKLKFLNAPDEKYYMLYLPQRNFPQLHSSNYSVQIALLVQ